jgi:hypothetical protein
MRAWVILPLLAGSLIASPLSAQQADQKEFHTWSIKGSPVKAVVKSLAGEEVTLERENGTLVEAHHALLNEQEREWVSSWIIKEECRIWQPVVNGTSLKLETENAKPQDFELGRTAKLNAALNGSFIKATFAVDDVTIVAKGKSKGMVRLAMRSQQSDARAMNRAIILPISKAVALKITKGSKVVIDGIVRYQFGKCPSCNGTGLAPCPNCSHGTIGTNTYNTVTMPNGSTVQVPTRVRTTCPVCHGTGRHGECRDNELGNWDPYAKKVPDKAFYFLSNSKGARRCYLTLDDVVIRIYATGQIIRVENVDGKVTVKSLPLPAEKCKAS